MAEEKVVAEVKAEEVKPVAKKKAVAKKAEKPVAEKKAEKPVAEKKVAAEKKAEKAPAKKAEKAVAEKKAPAKKAEKPAAEKKAPAKKAAVKANVTVEFGEKSYSQEKLVEIAKDVWQYDLKKNPADFKSVEIYVNAYESKAYYVVNGEVTGDFAL